MVAVIDEENARTTLSSLDPVTGEVVGTHPIDGPEEVVAAAARAREAAAWWAGLGFGERGRRLQAWKGVIARGVDELAALIRREMGKPLDDAKLEVVAAVNNLDWAAKNAERVLGVRRVRSGFAAIEQGSSVEHEPLGVVGVIGPWNFPVSTPMGLIAFALAAGNAVVFKPSEQTPGVARWLEEAFRSVVSEHPVLRVITGYGETGAALCTAGVDKIAFTGSARTGRKILSACARTLTPALLELGGKDAMIVAGDADVPAAAEAAVWGGFQNAGQGCISIERVFVVDAAYERFVAQVTEIASGIRAGAGPKDDIGPIVTREGFGVITEHVEDALQRGARAVVGGTPDVARAPFVHPIVLVDVPEDALVLREETFGPVLPIVRVRDAEEAIERANESGYALGASVYSKRRGRSIARRLRAGMVSVNSVIAFSLVPGLPFGGSGESGFGRKHGEEGLKEFARTKANTRQRFRHPVALRSFRRSGGTVDRVVRVARLLHGRT